MGTRRDDDDDAFTMLTCIPFARVQPSREPRTPTPAAHLPRRDEPTIRRPRCKPSSRSSEWRCLDARLKASNGYYCYIAKRCALMTAT